MSDKALVVKDDMSILELGTVLFKSGYFSDVRDANQAIVKVLAGRELGFGAFASMTGIHIIKGKPSMGANLIAAAVKRSGRYNYRVKENSNENCVIEFQERIDGKWENIGTSSFSLKDAQKAGTQNLDKYARNMLFARAMSNGAKWFTADVFGGPIYTPEEMGAKVDEEGEVIENVSVQPIAEQVIEAEVKEISTATSAPKIEGKNIIVKTHAWKDVKWAIAQDMPKYADETGSPNLPHLMNALAAEGITEINDANVQTLLPLLQARISRQAKEKMAETVQL